MVISTIFGKIIIPLFYYLRGDFRFYYFSDYKKNLKKSKSEIQELQWNKLKKLIKHAYSTTKYYRTLFDKIGIIPDDIKTLDDFKKIPPLTKRLIQKNEKDLLSNKGYKLKKLGTGGSTGNRMFVYMDKVYYQKSRSVLLRDLYSAGINPSDKSAWIWGSPIENKTITKNLKQKILWWINRRIIFDVAHYDEKDLIRWLKNDFIRFRPDYIYGYANLIYEVAKIVEKHKIKIPKLKNIVTTAEKLEHRNFIEKIFNCKVVDQYGSREVIAIAIEDNGMMRISDDFVYVETDKEGKIMLTPLESYGMPLLRYQNGDVGFKNEKKQTNDNEKFSVLNLKIGRTCEILYDNNGKRVTFGQFGDNATLKSNIKEWQIVQKSKELVHLNIVTTDETTQENINRLKQVVRDKLGSKKIVVKKLDRIPLEKSGKKIMYKCEIKENID